MLVSLRVYCYPGLQPTMPLLLTGEATWVTERWTRGQSTEAHRTTQNPGWASKLNFAMFQSIYIVLRKYSTETLFMIKTIGKDEWTILAFIVSV